MNKEQNTKRSADFATGLVSQYKSVNKEANTVENQIKKYGKTPVVYIPKKSWLKPARIPGLLYFISQATTESEVNNLLNRGKEQYKKASPKTIKMWIESAEQRIDFLKSTKE